MHAGTRRGHVSTSSVLRLITRSAIVLWRDGDSRGLLNARVLATPSVQSASGRHFWRIGSRPGAPNRAGFDITKGDSWGGEQS
jgi:hypothetical protein